MEPQRLDEPLLVAGPQAKRRQLWMRSAVAMAATLGALVTASPWLPDGASPWSRQSSRSVAEPIDSP
eukprot:3944721-Prymnesium_polylepis.1